MSVGHPGESSRPRANAPRLAVRRCQPEEFDCTVIATLSTDTPYYDEALAAPRPSRVWTYTCAETGRRGYTPTRSTSSSSPTGYKGRPKGGYKAFTVTQTSDRRRARPRGATGSKASVRLGTEASRFRRPVLRFTTSIRVRPGRQRRPARDSFFAAATHAGRPARRIHGSIRCPCVRSHDSCLGPDSGLQRRIDDPGYSGAGARPDGAGWRGVQVVVVNDASTDRTLERLRSRPDLIELLVSHDTNGGRRRGREVRRCAWRRATTSCFRTPISVRPGRIRDDAACPVLRFNADVVMGSRFLAPRYTRVSIISRTKSAARSSRRCST